MKLFVMRHGEAEAFLEHDEDRQLTEHGTAEVRKMASWLKRHAEPLDKVLVSPYIRAQQTLNTLKCSGVKMSEIEISAEVTPSGNAQIVWDYLSILQDHQSLLVVSHMPFVSYLVEAATNGQDAPIFATAGIAEIEITGSFNKLVSLVSPSSI